VAAADSFTRLVSIRPGHGLAWHNLGKSLFVLGQIDSAVNAYRTAAAVLPDERSCQTLCNIAVVIPGSAASDHRRVRDDRKSYAEKCLPPFPASKVFRAQESHPGWPIRLGYISAFY